MSSTAGSDGGTITSDVPFVRGHGNVAAIVTALAAVLAEHGIAIAAVHPWYYPTAAAYRCRLERPGFVVTSIELIPRPTPLPTGMAGWLDTFAEPLLATSRSDEVS